MVSIGVFIGIQGVPGTLSPFSVSSCQPFGIFDFPIAHEQPGDRLKKAAKQQPFNCACDFTMLEQNTQRADATVMHCAVARLLGKY